LTTGEACVPSLCDGNRVTTQCFTPRPTSTPTFIPFSPSVVPTSVPTSTPTSRPSSSSPSVVPTSVPTATPTSSPSAVPTCVPTSVPTSTPTSRPSSPSVLPSYVPTISPSAPIQYLVLRSCAGANFEAHVLDVCYKAGSQYITNTYRRDIDYYGPGIHAFIRRENYYNSNTCSSEYSGSSNLDGWFPSQCGVLHFFYQQNYTDYYTIMSILPTSAEGGKLEV
jgi:hypothetical protein